MLGNSIDLSFPVTGRDLAKFYRGAQFSVALCVPEEDWHCLPLWEQQKRLKSGSNVALNISSQWERILVTIGAQSRLL